MSTAAIEDASSASPRPGDSDWLRPRRPRYGEKFAMAVLRFCGVVSVATTVGIVVVLFVDASAFFRVPEISLWGFLSGTEWYPFSGADSGSFGVLPLVSATLLVTAIAVATAVPLGLATAAYLSDYAPPRVRRVVKPVLELLAGVPTVVLGWFALTFVTPLLRAVFGIDTVQVFNVLSAGLVMGIMIVPTVASLSEDAMSAVPADLRQAAYGLGAPQRTVVTRVVFPAALSGIVGAVILAVGRAIGETMIVAIAAGNLANLTANPFEQSQTMTAYIVQAVGGEAARGSLTYQSIFAIGALLFVVTFALNVLAQRFVRRFREVY